MGVSSVQSSTYLTIAPHFQHVVASLSIYHRRKYDRRLFYSEIFGTCSKAFWLYFQNRFDNLNRIKTAPLFWHVAIRARFSFTTAKFALQKFTISLRLVCNVAGSPRRAQTRHEKRFRILRHQNDGRFSGMNALSDALVNWFCRHPILQKLNLITGYMTTISQRDFVTPNDEQFTVHYYCTYSMCTHKKVTCSSFIQCTVPT